MLSCEIFDVGFVSRRRGRGLLMLDVAHNTGCNMVVVAT
jgi:hypothetical protein